MNRPLITILTPTYNRRQLLPRLYASLLEQSVSPDDFEWIIVDDGSTDGTGDYLSDIETNSPFGITIIHQKNGGKCSALNRGARIAKGKWISVLDSDDRMTRDALQRIIHLLKTRGSNNLGAIYGLTRFSGEVSFRFKSPDKLACFHDWANSQSTFDTTQIILRDLMRAHPYPLAPGEKYMSIGWLYNRIDESHKSIFVNEVFHEAEYQPEGLSAHSVELRANSPVNAMTTYADLYTCPFHIFLKIRSAINYWRFRFHARRLGKALPARSIPLPFAALGYFFHLKDLRVIGGTLPV
jgi:glycosyltransferase involved in cell wall biosynthesis